MLDRRLWLGCAIACVTACGVEFKGSMDGPATGGSPPAGAGGSAGDTSMVGSVVGAGGGDASQCGPGEQCVPATAELVVVINSASDCPTGWVSIGEHAPPTKAGCEPCSCGAPVPGSCSLGAVNGYFDGSCQNFAGTVAAANGSCYDYQGSPASFILAPATPSAGSCAPAGGQPVAVTVTQLCKLEQPTVTSCGEGFACVPEGGGEVCQLAAEATACDAVYTMTELVAPLLDDSRNCECTCDPATGASCAGSDVTVYANDNSCGAITNVVPADNVCHPISVGAGSLLLNGGTWTGGTCQAASNQTGELSFGTSVTLCCP